MVRTAHIDYSTFDIYSECNILTSVCTINVGDVIRVGCHAYWNGNPMDNVWIILRFQDFYGGTYHDVWLGKTDAAGWLAKNHTVTAEDIADLGTTGYVFLHSHSDPKAWGDSRAVYYVQPTPPYCDQPVKVVNKDTGAGIENVTVAARPTVGTIIRCTTDSWGKCALEGLIEGNDYRLVVEGYPEGYECQYTVDCEENITACETERTFRLRWTVPLPCNQPVKVIDKDTEVGMEGITIAAWQHGVKVKDCVTGSDGKCTILGLNRDQMYDIIVETAPEGYGCEYPEDCKYNMQMACDSEITFKLKRGVTPCECTGYASDAKIDHDDVPSSAAKGNEVNGSVSVDCIEGGETRYRVKFVLDGGSPVYSNSFLLGYVGEMDVLFGFTMPDHDVTVVAEVERCNASGEWEPCEHTDHIKTYTVTLTLYDGPYGVIAEGYPKISNESCLDTCENENPCTADEGERPDFEVEYKNAGNEDGYFQAFLIGYNGIGIDAPDAPEGEGKVFDSEFHVLPTSFKLGPGESRTVTLTPKLLCGSMPDTNWDLGIKIARITSLGFFEEWNDTKSFKVCYKQVVDHYSLALNDLPDELHTGDKITFSGKLSHDAGGVVNNKLIEIMEKDIDPDDFIAKGTTNPDGSFAIPWTVKKVGGWLEGKTAELYARFKFDSKEVTSNTERVAIVGPSLTKALVYGGIAVAAFAGGSIAESVAGPKGKMIGVPVKLCALIPAGLCGYQTYLIAKDKVPEWLKG